MIVDCFGEVEEELKEFVKRKFQHKGMSDDDLHSHMVELAKNKKFYRPHVARDTVRHIESKLEEAAAKDQYNGHAKRALDMMRKASPLSLIVRLASKLIIST